MMPHHQIFSGSLISVNRLAFLLEQKNIAVLVKDFPDSARLAGFGSPAQSVELYVNSSDLEEAKLVLADFLAQAKG